MQFSIYTKFSIYTRRSPALNLCDLCFCTLRRSMHAHIHLDVPFFFSTCACVLCNAAVVWPYLLKHPVNWVGLHLNKICCMPCYTQPIKYLRAYHSFRVLRECVYMYTIIWYCTLANQLCTHLYAPKYCHFVVYKCTYTAGRFAMHVAIMVRFCIRSLRAWCACVGPWAIHP